jgi:hypothetical protein
MEGTLTSQVSLPKPWDYVNISPDNRLTYIGLLNI